MGEVVYLKGTGGVVWPHTLPLPPEIEKQVVRHELVRVNADGSAWVEPATGEPPELKRPADSAPKPAWVGYAVARSEQLGDPITIDAADAMTKADLITRFGQEQPPPPPAPETQPTPEQPTPEQPTPEQPTPEPPAPEA